MTAGLLVPFPASLAAQCGRCGGRVVWAVTAANGKRIPLEWEPDEAGNQAVSRDVHGTPRTRQLREGEDADAGERLMVPHFPECERRRRERLAARAEVIAARSSAPNVTSLSEWRRRRAGRRGR